MCDENRIIENEGRTQSSVVVQQSELLRAVIQFLQEIGLVHSMRALEQESGLTAEPLSVEMYCLRDMAVRGQWHQIFKFLSPLEGVKGVNIAEIRMKVCKQEFLEQLRGTPVDSKNTFELVEYYKRLVLMLQQLSIQGISDEEHRKLSLLLTLPEIALQQEFKNWSIPGARLQLADEIMQAISKVFGYKGEDIDSGSSSLSSQPECDMKKEIKGRLIQLTAKGLFYEKCEKSILNDNCNTKMNTNQMIDIPSMLPRIQEDTQPPKLLNIVCEEENNNKHETKGVILSPIMSLSVMREKGKLDNVCVSAIDCDVEDKSTQIFSDLLREPKERPNGLSDVDITLKLKQEIGKDLNANTEVIAQSVTTQSSIDEYKPPLNDRISQSRTSIPDSITEQNAGRSALEEVKPQTLSTPQNDTNTKRNTPTPGCDSSTPKPDKARTVLTPMPDESPIQPLLQSDKQAIMNQQKHSQSLNTQTSRQQRPIVRKLDLEGTNESIKTRHHSAKIADVSSIPKAVQWMVGLGRDRETIKDKNILPENNPEEGTVEVEMQREMKNTIEIIQNLESNETEQNTPLVEKKSYKLIVSEDSETKNPAISPKFEPPYIQMIGELRDTQVVRSVSFHPTQKIIAVGANSKCLYLCQYNGHAKNTEMETEKLIPFKSFTNYHKGSLYCVEWSPLGSLLASASNDQSIRVLSMSTDTPLHAISEWEVPLEIRVHSGTVRALAFLNEKLLASGGAGDSQVRLVDVNMPTEVVTSLSHGGQINEVYSCTENELVTASQDEHIRIWDIRSSECVWKVRCLSSPSSVCTDKKELRIAASCEDGNLQIFDRRNTICFYSNKIHRKDVRSVRFKPATNDTLLTGSYDGEIKLTYPDLGVSHQIAKFAQKIIQCRFSPEAEYMVSSSTDKTVKLWEFSNTC